MQAQFVTWPAFTIVGMVLRATPMTPEIPKLWDRFFPRIDEIAHLSEPDVSYGVIDHYDPEAHQFDYMAGCAVTTVDALPTGMQRWDVPANTYAVFSTTLPLLGQVMEQIYNTWLPASGHRRGAGPYFERYDERFNPADPTSTFAIYIPIEKPA
ncbi:MAG TPA: AraC family transcriptional regulator [Chloroflexi bacterium]|nr:AraC family transcriptional regulator [Chloroflexota bacterium]HHW85487.1 AraC family transcriptional regulator [Chloroflexota bacterium]